MIASPIIGKDGEPENPGDDTPNAWKNKYTGIVIRTILIAELIEIKEKYPHELFFSFLRNITQLNGKRLKNIGHRSIMFRPGR